ncbi:hypothetical protein [Pseudodesulfovibrio indicus]|uniref:hypothetical protein n=1 Tax=Pseudodesulfovibrio indicus TaxID=1716143 RepID=UPI002931290D|nr:hypothetical protein [Pseudodesulfovibrio indicus]
MIDNITGKYVEYDVDAVNNIVDVDINGTSSINKTFNPLGHTQYVTVNDKITKYDTDLWGNVTSKSVGASVDNLTEKLSIIRDNRGLPKVSYHI